jgi:hypothetical protein
MTDELSRQTASAINDLSTAWENEDIPQTFEAALSDDGIVKAEGLSPLNPNTLNELASKGLIRITEGEQGKLSVKLLPALHRAANDVRAADTARERQYRANMRRIITGGR